MTIRSSAELLLATQLEQADIEFEREYRITKARRWRADFLVHGKGTGHDHFLIEVEGGSFTGGHKRGRAYESDCEKHNAATMAGFRVLRFTPAMVDDGRALAVIRQALGIEVAA